jgi:hypothetical protein
MYAANLYGSKVYGGVQGSSFTRTTRTVTAKGHIALNIAQIQAKASIRRNFSATVTAKASLLITTTQTTTTKGNILATIEQTVTSKAYIHSEVNETVRRVEPVIEIMWDGINWTDESTYCLSAQGNEQSSGVKGEGIASTLDVELDNTSDRFTTDNTESALYGYIKPRVPIKVSVIIGFQFTMFTGYIKNIRPDTKSKICSLECYDNQVLIYNKEANGIVYEDNRSDELLTILAGLAGLTSEQYEFDVGLHVVNFGYFEERNVWPVMGEIASAERGRIFFSREGILTFWNRDKLHNQSVISTLSQNDWIIDLNYSISEHEIKNNITVQAKPRASSGVQVVWSNGDAEYLDPYSSTLVMIPANGSQSAWLEMENPCTTFIQPIPDTDYTANSAQDGSGDDLTDDISITDFIEYGNAVYLNVVNTGSVDAYLTEFSVRGNPAEVLKYIQVVVKDDTSISLYGRQEETIENNFIQDESSASEIAYEELWRRQDAVNNFKIDIIGNPTLLCGDVVSVEYITGSYKNFMIDKLDWSLDSGGFKETLTLIDPYIFPSIQRVDARANIVSP